MPLLGIEAGWKMDLNLIDLALGREYWTGKRLSVHPHIGLRIGSIDQTYKLRQVPFIFRSNPNPTSFVTLKNDFRGIGARGGFDAEWHLNCGFGIYGNIAGSIVYGRFRTEHREFILSTLTTPTGKSLYFSTQNRFRASRAMLDMGFGINWEALLCQCQYGLSVSLARLCTIFG